MNLVLAYIPASSSEEAESIGHILLEKKLAACIHIFPHMSSQYWWKGDIHRAEEVLLIAKTSDDLFHDLKDEVQKIHSYECPCILSLSVENMNIEYERFVEQTLRKS